MQSVTGILAAVWLAWQDRRKFGGIFNETQFGTAAAWPTDRRTDKRVIIRLVRYLSVELVG